jgi:hypothetical protein
MEFRLPFIQYIQRIQVKKPFYDENIIILYDNNLIKSRWTYRAFSHEICLFMKKKHVSLLKKMSEDEVFICIC